MKIPKRIIDLLNKKQDYIDLHRTELEKSVVKLQSQFLNELLADLLPDMTFKEGSLLDVLTNYRKLSQVEDIYKKFAKIQELTILPQIVNTTYGLVALENSYIGVALIGDLGSRFGKIVSATEKKINMRIGLEGGKMVRGGFLESFFTDKTLATQVKSFVSKSITGQVDTKVFIKGLTDIVEGVPREVIKDGVKTILQTGALEKQYERYAYDIYQQYDRAYNTSLADEFDMKYFVYQGGLIDDSRDFCAAHNNKVWTRDEAALWGEWTPSIGEYPAGYVIKSKNPYEVPSYLGYPGYQPLTDAGGYNCRHSIGFISDDLAFDLRQDLKKS